MRFQYADEARYKLFMFPAFCGILTVAQFNGFFTAPMANSRTNEMNRVGCIALLFSKDKYHIDYLFQQILF
jgi:hypothetical protein